MPGAITSIGAGYAAGAYLIRTAEGERVLRLPKPPLDRSRAILRREARLLRALEGHDLGVAIPREVRTIVEGRALLGTLHRHVPGARFPRGLRGEARERLCAGIGHFLAALHAVPTEVVTRADLPPLDLWDDVYRALVEETLPHLGATSATWLSGIAEEFLRGGGTRRAPRVLVHGDIQANHLLATEDGTLSGVIDFGNAMLTDPALDFAGVLNDLGWRDLERVWAAYEVAGGTVDADAERRVRFIIAVVPIYRVLYGEAAEGPAERRAGVRQLAARAAASNRRGAITAG